MLKLRDGVWLAIGLVLGILAYHTFSILLFPPVVLPIFSPDNGHSIIDYIDSAKTSIDIEMYLFTSKDALAALERAKFRGVTIRVILEKNVIANDNQDIFNAIASDGISVRYASTNYALTHSKFIIVDGHRVLVGSHNLSNAALNKNREASVIITDLLTVAEFQSVFEKDWLIST